MYVLLLAQIAWLLKKFKKNVLSFINKTHKFTVFDIRINIQNFINILYLKRISRYNHNFP